MLMSVDGKISTGSSDNRDVDKDFPHVKGAAEGLSQYYALEEETDLYSFNTGKVLAKVGWNDEKDKIDKIPVTFIIIDNKPHLTKLGIENLTKRAEKVILITNNVAHPAYDSPGTNLEVIHYTATKFTQLFQELSRRGIERLTIQSGGDMNASLLRAGLIKELSLVVAPALVGGKQTASLIGGESLQSNGDLRNIKALELIEAKPLQNSYLHLRYKVLQ